MMLVILWRGRLRACFAACYQFGGGAAACTELNGVGHAGKVVVHVTFDL